MMNNAEYFSRREIWQRKPQIRLVYERWIKKLQSFLPAENAGCGAVIEVGSGSGLLKDLLPEVMLTDVVPLPWIDWVVDCMHMPFADSSIGAIIGFDMLHHVGDPHAFLREAARVLKPGGRLLLMEPFITPVSFVGYKLLHHEAIDLSNYHPVRSDSSGKKDPWEGNLAMSNLVFRRDAKDWPTLQSSLKILHKELFSFFDFQLAAGFKPYAYVPNGLFRHLAPLDDFLSPLMRLIGFRIFVVLQKQSA